MIRSTFYSLFLCLWCAHSFAADTFPELSCREGVVIYLDADGRKTLDPSYFVDDCPNCIVDIVGEALSDTADCSVAGKMISVQVRDPGSNQSIFCTALIKDIFKPEFISCPTLEIGCHLNVLEDPVDSFGLQVTDACGLDSVYPIICDVIPGDCVNTIDTLKVLWQAVDIHGNIASCLQYLAYRKPDIDDVSVEDDTLYCEDVNYDSLGSPMLNDSIPINPYCGILINEMKRYELSGCGSSKDIIRVWSILDKCTLASRMDTQYVCVLDTLGPIIEEMRDTIFVNDTLCTVSYLLPESDTSWISHNCPEDRTAYLMYDLDGELWRPGLILSLDTGVHEIGVIAADACWNYDTGKIILTVWDHVGPLIDSCPPDVAQFIYFEGMDTITHCDTLNRMVGGPASFLAHCCPLDSVFCLLDNQIDPVSNTGFITRSWWAVDSCGNVSDTCTQRIMVQDVRLEHVGKLTNEIKPEMMNAVKSGVTNELPMTRLNDEFHDAAAMVYPNPFSRYLTLNLANTTNEWLQIEIFDATGKIWYQKPYYSSQRSRMEIDLDFSTLPSGLFMLKISGSAHGVSTHKILHSY